MNMPQSVHNLINTYNVRPTSRHLLLHACSQETPSPCPLSTWTTIFIEAELRDSSINLLQLHHTVSNFCPKQLYQFEFPSAVDESSHYFIALTMSGWKMFCQSDECEITSHCSKFALPRLLVGWTLFSGHSSFFFYELPVFIFYHVVNWTDFQKNLSTVVFTCKYPAHVFCLVSCHMLSSNLD